MQVILATRKGINTVNLDPFFCSSRCLLQPPPNLPPLLSPICTDMHTASFLIKFPVSYIIHMRICMYDSLYILLTYIR